MGGVRRLIWSAFGLDGRRFGFLRPGDLEVDRRKEIVGSLFGRRREGFGLEIGGRGGTGGDTHGRDGLVPFILCHDDASNSIQKMLLLEVLDADDSKREATGQGWLLS